jgi:Tfp pilus assembly protein PilX
MSDDRERGSDGLLIGFLVILFVLVLGGMGLFGLRFVRMSRAVDMERMAAEQARMEAMRQLDAAEAARARAESAAAAELEARNQASEDEQRTAVPKTKPNEGESREKQP